MSHETQKEYCLHLHTKIIYEISNVCSIASANTKYEECVDCGEIIKYNIQEE